MTKYILPLIASAFIFIGCGSDNSAAVFQNNNSIPVIEDISLSTSNNQSLNISLPSYDSDGDELSYEIIDPPSNGSASFSNGILLYNPNPNYSGIEKFTYRAYDGIDYSETKEVTIVVNINLNNTQPTVSNIVGSTTKNLDFITVLPSEDIDGDKLTYNIVTQPNNGTVIFNSNILIYTPNTDFFGNDTFTFITNDGIIDSSEISAVISVDNLNNAPIIFSSEIPEGTEGVSYSYTIPVVDPDGDSFTTDIEVVDSLGNSIATPSWLSIDSLNTTINSDSIDINADPIIYIKIVATDSFGAISTSIKELNIVDYSPFSLTWNTSNVGDSDDNTIAFYVELNPNNIIDWGDGNIEYNLQNGNLSHIYAIAGIYEVKIVGAKAFETYGLNGGPRNNSKIISINNWGSSKWISMKYIFRGAVNLISLATDFPNVSNVTDMSYAFESCWSYNGVMNDWDVSSVKNMDYMFSAASSFNQPLNKWDTGNVTNMYYMFNDTSFNQDIGNWDTGSVTTMGAMFNSTPFNQDISSWDVSNVTNFGSMFSSTPFNQPIGSWDVSSATSLSHMFIYDSQFDQDLSSWDVSNVTNMHNTFYNTAFNQPIGSWDVSNVVLFEGLFRGTPFNQNLSSWDVSNAIDLDYMFYSTTNFDQDLSSWTPINATTLNGFLNFANSYSTTNYDALLNAWSTLTLKNAVNFGANNTNYTIAVSDVARTNIITNFTWNITDGGGI